MKSDSIDPSNKVKKSTKKALMKAPNRSMKIKDLRKVLGDKLGLLVRQIHLLLNPTSSSPIFRISFVVYTKSSSLSSSLPVLTSSIMVKVILLGHGTSTKMHL
jgi:hypothetical protein